MSKIGFNIYELTPKDMYNGTAANSLLLAGLAYDFGDDMDGSSYIAIPCDDDNSNDFLLDHHPNSFLFSMGAISAGEANDLFNKLLNKKIEMDDIPPAPSRKNQTQAAHSVNTGADQTITKAKPKAPPKKPPAPPLANTTTVAKPRRPTPDMRSTDFRIRFFQDKKRRARIAAASAPTRS